LIDIIKPNLSLSSMSSRYSQLPESNLMALMIIAIRLFHPPGYNTSIINWTKWEKVINNLPSVASHISKVDTDVLSMTDVEIDQYLAWFEKNWVVDEEDVQFPRGILSIFPIPQGQSDSPKLVPPTFWDRIHDIYGVDNTCHLNYSMPEVKKYQSYRKYDDKPAEYTLLLAKASEIVGITVVTLERAIRDFERHIIQWIGVNRNTGATLEESSEEEVHDIVSDRVEEHSKDLDHITVDEDGGSVYELSE